VSVGGALKKGCGGGVLWVVGLGGGGGGGYVAMFPGYFQLQFLISFIMQNSKADVVT